MSTTELQDSIEDEVQRRLLRARDDDEFRARYGLSEPIDEDQLRRVITLEVQTEHQRRQNADDSDPDEQPLRLQERYELRRELGRGAQGRTYLGYDWRDEKKVAVKELLLRDVEDWKALELFEREGQALKYIDHQGIPGYVDAFHIDDDGSERFFLVQQFVDGTDFSSLIDDGLTFDEEEAQQFLAEMLEILIYLQSRSPPVIHRDIKPSNIMRCADGSLALIDFGAVQSVIPNQKGGSTIIGTSGYMPVEQLMGRAQPATDIYALGVTVIHLLSRRHPADLPIKNWRLQFEDVVNISRPFSDYLARMTAPQVSNRFPTAQAAKGALIALRNPTPTPVAPQRRELEERPTVRREPIRATRRRRFDLAEVIGKILVSPIFIVTILLVFTFLLFFGWPIYITIQDSRAEAAVAAGDFETAAHYRERACNAGAGRACAYLSAVAIDFDPELAYGAARQACSRDIALGCANLADYYLRQYSSSEGQQPAALRDAWRYAERGCAGESDTGCARLAMAELYLQNFDEAQRAALRGVGINDRQPYPHKALGLTLVIDGDVEDGLRSFAEASRAAANPQGREHPIFTRPLAEVIADRLDSLVAYYPESRGSIEEATAILRSP